MEINVKEYFTEIIDESRSTIGYSLNPYKDIELVKAIYEQNEQLQQLKEENEELKKKIKYFQEWQKADEIKSEKASEIGKQMLIYKKKIEDIEEYCNNHLLTLGILEIIRGEECQK